MIATHWLDMGVFSVLGLMGVLWLWVLFERLLFLSSVDVRTYHTAGTLQLALTRNLTLMSTVAANAPYIGLLGTVLGIMVALYDVGMAGSMDPSKIMVGLALALKATAAGIVLAVLGMVSVNLLMRQVDVLTVRWQDAQESPNAH
jgi:biopolymer transport protein ExbB